jgi:serine/threonine-protein kinase
MMVRMREQPGHGEGVVKPPQWLSGRYELGELLGTGSHSRVYEGWDARLARPVAIKLPRAEEATDPQVLDGFTDAARQAAMLRHPAIVAVYDTGEEATAAGVLPYIVMEYVDGETVAALVAAERQLAPGRAGEIVADVCAACEFAHRREITHGSLSPATVMLTQTGMVKVTDFGSPSSVAPAGGDGWPLPPEQDRGDAPDARCDVHSAGCLLSYLLTGAAPSAEEISAGKRRGRAGSLERVVATATSPNPAKRYSTAAAMRSAVVEAMPASAAAGTPKARGERARRRRWLAALPVVGGLAVLGLLVWFAVSLLAPGGQGRVAVPAVQGQAVSSASAALQKAGLAAKRHPVPCQPRAGHQAPCQASQVGTVLRSNPEHGSKVDRHQVVQLYVGAAAQQVSVPGDLSGSSVSAATSKLKAAGLRVAAHHAHRTASHPTLAGKVVGTKPAGGKKLAKGSPVTLILGAAPAPTTSPSPTTSPPATTRPSPTTSATTSQKHHGSLGNRGPNGRGKYVCTKSKLYFASCNKDKLGKVVPYPTYSH